MENCENTTGDKANFINISSAVKLTGVSKDTLLKFVEVGCLTPTNKLNNTTDSSEENNEHQDWLFNKQELLSLIGAEEEVDVKKSSSFIPSASPVSFSDSSNDNLAEKIEVSTIDSNTTNLNEEEILSSDVEETNLLTETFDDSNISNSVFSSPKIEEAQTATAQITTPQISTKGSDNNTTNQQHPRGNLRSYIQIIKNQDKIIANKDEQISSLEKQVSWLRSRIETAEVNSEREKMLLMTQAKTIQDLSESITNKPSLIKGFLQSVGLLPPPQ